MCKLRPCLSLDLQTDARAVEFVANEWGLLLTQTVRRMSVLAREGHRNFLTPAPRVMARGEPSGTCTLGATDGADPRAHAEIA